MMQDTGRDTSQPRGHVQDAGLRRRMQAGAHLELAKYGTLPVLVQLAIPAVEDGTIGVGLVKSHTRRERLADACHQGGGGQAGVAGRRHRALVAVWRRRRSGGGGASAFSMALAGAGFEVVRRRRGVDLREISNAIMGHSVVSLKLGYSGTGG